MPETRGEWLLFLLGLVAVAALAVTIVHLRQRSSAPTPAAAPTTTAQAAATPPEATTTVSTQTRFSLELRALTDTWLQVREQASTGRILYEGTLAAGDHRSFTGLRLWLRFGAASNIEATLDGRRLRLPGGTYSAPITAAGLGPRTT